jgi:hypothetical protein
MEATDIRIAAALLSQLPDTEDDLRDSAYALGAATCEQVDNIEEIVTDQLTLDNTTGLWVRRR